MNPIKICFHLERRLVDSFMKISEISPYCQFKHSEEETDAVQIWYCMHCGKNGCSRYSKNRCMEVHSKAEKHYVCVNVEEGTIWCYGCDEELHEYSSENIGQEGLSKTAKDFADKIQEIDEKVFKLKRKSSFPVSLPIESPLQVRYVPHQNSHPITIKDNIFGLKNLGNTCFFNSVMQILLASDNFLKPLTEVSNRLGNASMSAEILALANAHHETVRNPKFVFSKLIGQKKMFGFFNQQDSHECFVTILEALENEFKSAKIKVESLPFYGYLVYKCCCLKCSHTEWIFQDNTNFLLDLNEDNEESEIKIDLWREMDQQRKDSKFVKIDNRSIVQNKNVLASGFDSLKGSLFINIEKEIASSIGESNTEQLIARFFDFSIYSRSKNNYKCDKCKDHSTFGYNKYYILKAPEILVICLKKFEKTAYGMKKYSKSVTFSLEMDLSRYVLEESGKPYENLQYELYGAVQHSGSLNGGHYVCYVKKESGSWYYISDSYYNKVSASTALASDAYLLFYKRK
jgi:ubiquitin C-terminal hydrolase